MYQIHKTVRQDTSGIGHVNAQWAYDKASTVGKVEIKINTSKMTTIIIACSNSKAVVVKDNRT